MKKRLVFYILCVVLCLSVFVMLSGCSKEVEVGTFSIDTYEWEIEHFPYEGENVGEIKDAETAIEKAKKLFVEKYGEDYETSGVHLPSKNEKDGFEIIVMYNEPNDCWIVTYEIIPYDNNTICLGVCPTAIIKGDGTVLAVGSF